MIMAPSGWLLGNCSIVSLVGGTRVAAGQDRAGWSRRDMDTCRIGRYFDYSGECVRWEVDLNLGPRYLHLVHVN
jgi:hypothetical protein